MSDKDVKEYVAAELRIKELMQQVTALRKEQKPRAEVVIQYLLSQDVNKAKTKDMSLTVCSYRNKRALSVALFRKSMTESGIDSARQGKIVARLEQLREGEEKIRLKRVLKKGSLDD